MMTGETDERSREAWIASLDKVAALRPETVVAGHKSVGAPDRPESIGASQQYLRDFSRIVSEGGSLDDIVAEMLKLHGDRDNPRPSGTPPASPSTNAAESRPLRTLRMGAPSAAA